MDRRTLALSVSGTILDAGCADALFYWNGHPPPNVTCLDLDIYRHTHVRADAHFMPFRDNSFDYVFLFEILEHVYDVEAVLKEALRVAKYKVLGSYPNEPFDVWLENQRKYFNRQTLEQAIADHLKVESTKGLIEEWYDHKAHYHWKDRERIKQDIEIIEKYCDVVEYELGWLFMCQKVGLGRELS